MDTKEYDIEYIFKKLKKRVINCKPKEVKKIKIEEPVVVDLKVIPLG